MIRASDDSGRRAIVRDDPDVNESHLVAISRRHAVAYAGATSISVSAFPFYFFTSASSLQHRPSARWEYR